MRSFSTKNVRDDPNQLLADNLPALSIPTVLIVCLFALLTCFLYYSDVQEIVKNSIDENADFFTTIEAYRNYTIGIARNNVEEVGKISTLSSLCFRAIEVVSVYIVANFFFLSNEARKKTWKRYAICIALLSLVLFFPTGSRSPLVHLIVAGFVIGGLQFKFARKKFSLQLTIRIIILLLVLLGLFALLSIIRGESMRLGFVGYISFFLGSGIASFNQVLDADMLNSMALPFTSLLNLINRFGIETGELSQAPWISYEGYDSNVFTALSSYYAYSGLLGTLAYCIVIAIVMTLLYLKAVNTKKIIWVSTYAFFGFVLFDAIRTDALSTLIGVPLVEYVIFLAIVPILLMKTDAFFKGDRGILRRKDAT